mmetsp:Transcript_89714/g.256415  ORF Transcript_89714/g.256415 Transcript_89714/m.256415 type:complete len:206 (-) Transcript_89714:876-1493(-)
MPARLQSQTALTTRTAHTIRTTHTAHITRTTHAASNMCVRMCPSTSSRTDQEGVSVRVPDWGQTTAFESLSPSLLLEGATHYFSKFNDALEDGESRPLKLLASHTSSHSHIRPRSHPHPHPVHVDAAGYSRGSSIRGAPYDFRYAPPSMESFETELKALVEETYAANDNTPVTMVSHSMGCYHALYFLQQQSQVLIRKYSSTCGV